MPRVKVDWRSSSKDNYILYCKSNPTLRVSYDEWKNIIYTFNNSFREYILETGEKAKLPFGIGEFSINKKKRQVTKCIKGVETMNLPIDWAKSKLKGKRIYNFNYHTEGFFFGWIWFKRSSMLKLVDCRRFKPSRTSSRLLAHYIKTDDQYQHLYKQWEL